MAAIPGFLNARQANIVRDMSKSVNGILAFGIFRKHMREVVIPTQLAGIIETEEESSSLITAQWAEMPAIERKHWEAEATKRQKLVSDSVTAAGSFEPKPAPSLSLTSATGAAFGAPPQPTSFEPVRIVIVGDAAVGKSSWAKRMRNGEFLTTHTPTDGLDCSKISFETNHGRVVFDLWTVSGHEKWKAYRDGYYFGASAVILMYDVENRVSYRNLPHWRTEVLRTCTSQRLPQQKDCLMLLVGNKVDSRERKVPAKAVLFHRKVNMDYFEISVAANYNLDKPFVHLLKKLMDKPDLALVESPAYGPPSKAFDPRETEEALARAAATVFVESEDE